MNIIALSNEDMNKATIYHLTKSPEVEKMSEVSDTEEITVSDWAKNKRILVSRKFAIVVSFSCTVCVNVSFVVNSSLTAPVNSLRAAGAVSAFAACVIRAKTSSRVIY